MRTTAPQLPCHARQHACVPSPPPPHSSCCWLLGRSFSAPGNIVQRSFKGLLPQASVRFGHQQQQQQEQPVSLPFSSLSPSLSFTLSFACSRLQPPRWMTCQPELMMPSKWRPTKWRLPVQRRHSPHDVWVTRTCTPHNVPATCSASPSGSLLNWWRPMQQQHQPTPHQTVSES